MELLKLGPSEKLGRTSIVGRLEKHAGNTNERKRTFNPRNLFLCFVFLAGAGVIIAGNAFRTTGTQREKQRPADSCEIKLGASDYILGLHKKS